MRRIRSKRPIFAARTVLCWKCRERTLRWRKGLLLRARKQAAWKAGVLLRGSVWREALRESLRGDSPVWVGSDKADSITVIESESEATVIESESDQ